APEEHRAADRGGDARDGRLVHACVTASAGNDVRRLPLPHLLGDVPYRPAHDGIASIDDRHGPAPFVAANLPTLVSRSASRLREAGPNGRCYLPCPFALPAPPLGCAAGAPPPRLAGRRT